MGETKCEDTEEKNKKEDEKTQTSTGENQDKANNKRKRLARLQRRALNQQEDGDDDDQDEYTLHTHERMYTTPLLVSDVMTICDEEPVVNDFCLMEFEYFDEENVLRNMSITYIMEDMFETISDGTRKLTESGIIPEGDFKVTVREKVKSGDTPWEDPWGDDDDGSAGVQTRRR